MFCAFLTSGALLKVKGQNIFFCSSHMTLSRQPSPCQSCRVLYQDWSQFTICGSRPMVTSFLLRKARMLVLRYGNCYSEYFPISAFFQIIFLQILVEARDYLLQFFDKESEKDNFSQVEGHLFAPVSQKLFKKLSKHQTFSPFISAPIPWGVPDSILTLSPVTLTFGTKISKWTPSQLPSGTLLKLSDSHI